MKVAVRETIAFITQRFPQAHARGGLQDRERRGRLSRHPGGGRHPGHPWHDPQGDLRHAVTDRRFEPTFLHRPAVIWRRLQRVISVGLCMSASAAAFVESSHCGRPDRDGREPAEAALLSRAPPDQEFHRRIMIPTWQRPRDGLVRTHSDTSMGTNWGGTS